jgi:hypothetical protein
LRNESRDGLDASASAEPPALTEHHAGAIDAQPVPAGRSDRR